MIPTKFTHDSRAATFNVSYIISIGIISILLIGLSASFGTILDSQESQVIDQQIEVVGEKTSTSVMAAERVVLNSQQSNITLVHTLPEEAVNTQYNVTLHEQGNSPQITVRSVPERNSFSVQLQLTADVITSSVNGGQNIGIAYRTDPTTGDRTVRLVRDPFNTIP